MACGPNDNPFNDGDLYYDTETGFYTSYETGETYYDEEGTELTYSTD